MCFRKKYKSLEEIEIDVFESNYKKRGRNCARLIKYFSKYPDMFEKFDQEELKTLKAYCYVFYPGDYIYRCQKIKEYLFPQIKQYVNGERELGSLESLSFSSVRANLLWIKGSVYSANNPEEYGFINCLISFSELNTFRSDIDSDEQIKNAGEIFDKGKKFIDKETVDVFQKMFDIFAKKHSAPRTGSISYEHGKYEGEIVWDKPNGKGKFIYDDGSIYEGQFKDGCFNGFGTYKWTNGDHFEGMYKDDVRNGKGKYYYSDGDVVECNYENDKRHGPYKYYFYDKKTKKFKQREEGEYIFGMQTGVAKVFVEKNGKDCLDLFRIYEAGDFKMDIRYEALRRKNSHNEFGARRYYDDNNQPSYKPTGPCKKIPLDENVYYYGEYKFAYGRYIMDGNGTFYNSDGSWIEGSFEDGVINSGTIFANKDEKVYHGQLELFGIITGYGVFYSVGDYAYLDGYFKEGIIDVSQKYVGKCTYDEGIIYEGEFLNKMPHGKGYITRLSDETVEEAYFYQGKPGKKYRLYYKDGSYEDFED
ncbi:MAG: hypothetical protein E7177_00650 [Erysipelotrichaceae bacterium]|nr:hypothetical protein [Erysipelotrichaceae bacterium]